MVSLIHPFTYNMVIAACSIVRIYPISLLPESYIAFIYLHRSDDAQQKNSN